MDSTLITPGQHAGESAVLAPMPRRLTRVRFGGYTESTEVPRHIWKGFLRLLAAEAVPGWPDVLQADWDLCKDMCAPIPPYAYRSHRYTRFRKGGFRWWVKQGRRDEIAWEEVR